jgi:hypothetical protein
MVRETDKRKPNFDERNSVPITLADGQLWYFPKPWLEIRPTFRGGKAIDSYSVLTHGADLDALVEAISDCEDTGAQVIAAASLAAHLLGWQYNLTDEDLNTILAFRLHDPKSLEWMKAVFDVATGRSGPKVGRAGGD